VTAAAADADVMANPSAAALLRCCLSHRRDLKFKKTRLMFILFVTCLHINVEKKKRKKPKKNWIFQVCKWKGISSARSIPLLLCSGAGAFISQRPSQPWIMFQKNVRKKNRNSPTTIWNKKNKRHKRFSIHSISSAPVLCCVCVWTFGFYLSTVECSLYSFKRVMATV
jgi:hypothetical protein